MTTLDKMLQGLANALGASLSTLTTTAKTVVGAINELKSGLTTLDTKTDVIGTGTLDTTNKTIIPAINELAARNADMVYTSFYGTYIPTTDTYYTVGSFTTTRRTLLMILKFDGDSNYFEPYLKLSKNAAFTPLRDYVDFTAEHGGMLYPAAYPSVVANGRIFAPIAFVLDANTTVSFITRCTNNLSTSKGVGYHIATI